MISIRGLVAMLEGDRVVFDEHGHAVELAVPPDVGPAALLVSDVTDALKRVDESGRIVESVDRRGMWEVEALVLSSVVLGRLEDGELSVEDLMEAVRAAGFSWQVRPISVP